MKLILRGYILYMFTISIGSVYSSTVLEKQNQNNYAVCCILYYYYGKFVPPWNKHLTNGQKRL